METFPNYTEEMYEGNKPNYYNDGINGKIAHYSCKYGGGEIDSDGELIYSNISLDKLNNIYIVGNWVKFNRGRSTCGLVFCQTSHDVLSGRLWPDGLLYE